MVEVTKSNFDLVEKRIQNLLPSCLFVSIDLEFTGLRADPNRNRSRSRLTPNRHDLPSQLYIKTRHLIDNFMMIQIGICLWNKNGDSSSKITANPFNFWSFPKHDSKSTFLCQTSSLIFLREHGFDFNKLIDSGINFLSIDEERREREHHDINEHKKQIRVNERKEQKVIVEPRTQKDIDFMAEIEQKIADFSEEETDIDSTLELGAVNRFRRLLIYQLIDTKYCDSLIAFKHNDNNNNNNNNFKSFLRNISVKKVNTNSKRMFENQQKRSFENEWNDKMQRFIGVRRIFDLISQHKMPIIVHNGFLDIMHLFKSFIGSLPYDPCSFSQRLHHHLPFIYDTRYIMQYLFKRNETNKTPQNYSLSHCFQFLMEKDDDNKDEDDDHKDIDNIALNIDVCIEMNEKRDKEKEKEYLSSKDGTFHEAGYDAFCTGYIFAKILNKKEYVEKEYVNRLNISNNYCKHFYVGSEYHISDKFRLNDIIKESDDNKIDDGVFCGVDYNAINDDWYKMFYCWIHNQSIQYNIEKDVIQYLNKYIEQQNRISVYKRGIDGDAAVIRITDITDNEHKDIVNSFNNKQENNLKFMKYIDYKSNELKESYYCMYGTNKKRGNEWHDTEPPRKKQRTN